MSHKSPWRGILTRLCPATRSGTDALHAAITNLQEQMVDLRERVANSEAGLIALREAIDRDERIETLRLRVEGLCAQHRWDADELRRALTALAETLPLAD